MVLFSTLCRIAPRWWNCCLLLILLVQILLSLVFRRYTSMNLVSYCDSDWAANKHDSLNGLLVFMMSRNFLFFFVVFFNFCGVSVDRPRKKTVLKMKNILNCAIISSYTFNSYNPFNITYSLLTLLFTYTFHSEKLKRITLLDKCHQLLIREY